jgi:hypothetical protein
MSQTAIAHIIYPTPHFYLQCHYDDVGLLTYDTIENTFITNPNYSLNFLLSYFNSKLFAWCLYKIVYCQAVRSTRFDDIYVAKMPIRKIQFKTSITERKKLLESIVVNIEGKEIKDVLEKIEEWLPKDKKGNFITEREKSDAVHDLLAYLAEQMTEMNKDSQKIVNEFLSWLENEFIKGSIEKLKNKTKIENFYDYPIQSIIDTLKLNNLLPKLIRHDDQRYLMLITTLEKAMSKLTPFKQGKDITDNLIDQIVYKLYSLTDEEIKIIEGTNTN